MEAKRSHDVDRQLGKPVVSRRVAAEASIWFSRLRGSPTDVGLMLRCLAWQARSPSRRYAFNRVQAVWDELGKLRGGDA